MENFISENNGRIDKILAEILSISRNQTANLIKSKCVFVNEICVDKASFELGVGDNIAIDFPSPKPQNTSEKVDFEVEIIYEDEDLLVINKPAGLVVHPAPSVKESTLVDWLKAKNFTLSTINGEIRAGIVHRLDKGTSGVMVVAKSNFAHAKLAEQLSDKSMGRIYLAITDLRLKENVMIDRPIGINPKNRLKKAIVPGGRAAKSAFCNIYNGDFNLISAKLYTGRTHQIRVHLASINRHILGDDLYGIKSNSDRILLHAYLLYFYHPRTGEMMKFRANLDKEFTNLIEKSKDKELIYEKISPSIIWNDFSDADEWLCYQ